MRLLGIYPDRLAITRLGTKSEDGVAFISYSYALYQRRVDVLSCWVHKQNSITPGHGIVLYPKWKMLTRLHKVRGCLHLLARQVLLAFYLEVYLHQILGTRDHCFALLGKLLPFTLSILETTGSEYQQAGDLNYYW